MSDPPKSSKRPEKRTRSGEHEIVVEYRRKLQSIADHEGEKLDELDAKLEEYLQDVRSTPPPPMPQAEPDTVEPGEKR